MQEFDAIIVGGGHNGLVCAAYLAQRGASVLVLEQKHKVGGCVVTEEVAPGWRINTYSFEHYVIQNTPIVTDLALGNFGLRYYTVDPVVFSPFKDRNFMMFYRKPSNTIKYIARLSKRDSKAYRKFHGKWSKFAAALAMASYEKPAPLEQILAKSPSYKNIEARRDLIEEIKSPAARILSETFETEYVSSPIAFLGPAAVGQSPAAPGTGWLLAWHVGAEKLARPVGGSGRLSESLSKAAISFGAKVVTNERVKRILVKDGRAIGVLTKSAKKFYSKVVVSNADPKQTLLKLVDGDEHLSKVYRKKVEGIKVSNGFTLKADYLLSKLPDYSCNPMNKLGTANQSHTAATFVAPSVESLTKAFNDYSEVRNPVEPGLMVALHSSTDSTLVPKGKHSLVLETRYTPYRVRGRNWTKEMVEAESERLLAIYSEYCPGVEKLVERSIALSPPDMERDVMIPGGNFMHADMTLDQMFDARPAKGVLDGYESKAVSGLYLCGAGTHPGGAVSGIPGRNAAMQVLGRLTCEKQIP